MKNSSKKRKLDYEEVNINNYLEVDLEEYKTSLYAQKSYLQDKILMIESKLKETNTFISKKCEKINGSHEWISEREEGMYGERFTFCKHCRVDIYDRQYLH